jgi:hypothetical protein
VLVWKAVAGRQAGLRGHIVTSALFFRRQIAGSPRRLSHDMSALKHTPLLTAWLLTLTSLIVVIVGVSLLSSVSMPVISFGTFLT